VLSQWLGCVRSIYNGKCDEDRYYRTFARKSLQHAGQYAPVDQQYAQFKSPKTPWLSECPGVILRNAAVRWHQAYQRYFKKLSGRPVRKNKGNHDSMWLTSEAFRFDPVADAAGVIIEHKLLIGTKTNNVGYLKFEAHRDYQLPKSVTVSRTNGQWWVSFCYQDDVHFPTHTETLAEIREKGSAYVEAVTVGIDRGVAIPICVSNGPAFDFSEVQKLHLSRKEAQRRRYQRKLARQIKGSRRRALTKARIAKTYEKCASIRRDFAHKASRTLADSEHRLFIVEALAIANMTRKPAAKPDGRGGYLRNHSKQKAGLNAAILKAAWGQSIRFLGYKTVRAGKLVLELPCGFSSQECAVCGHTHPDNRISQAEFRCVSCGHVENADVNAGQVMRARGVAAVMEGNPFTMGSDYILKRKTAPAGTRGSARGGKRKTRPTMSVTQSRRDANLIAVSV